MAKIRSTNKQYLEQNTEFGKSTNKSASCNFQYKRKLTPNQQSFAIGYRRGQRALLSGRKSIK